MIRKYYPFGYSGYQFLESNNTRYIHSELLPDNSIRVIECDIEEKWMKVREKRENEVDWKEIEDEDVKKGDVLDLNEKLGYGKYHIEEEGLCGRTTIFEDPLRDNRNGSRMLPALLETHQHADLIIVMLGTNDCKAAYGASAEMIGKGIEKIVGQIRMRTEATVHS